jgi:nucleoside-diphosphate-sugar epimerase
MDKRINVLVVGGTGFIGKNFIYYSKNKNWKIISISKNIPLKKEKFTWATYKKCNIFNDKDISKINLKNFNYIIYAAGPEILGDFKKKKDLNHQKKFFISLKKFIRKTQSGNLKKFIFFGSSEEYGFLKSPHTENQKPKKFYNPYGFYKSKSSNYLIEQFKNNGLPVVILRVYLTYGPFQRENRILPKYLKAFYQKKKIEVTSGEQKKNFMFISDLISLIHICIKNSKANGQIINAGYKRPIKLKKVFDILRDSFKINPVVELKKMRKSELGNNYPNISKAKKILNWSPKISLLKGLKQTLKYYKKLY